MVEPPSQLLRRSHQVFPRFNEAVRSLPRAELQDDDASSSSSYEMVEPPSQVLRRSHQVIPRFNDAGRSLPGAELQDNDASSSSSYEMVEQPSQPLRRRHQMLENSFSSGYPAISSGYRRLKKPKVSRRSVHDINWSK